MLSSVGPSRRGTWLLTVVGVVAALGFLCWRWFGPSDGGSLAFYTNVWTVDGVRISTSAKSPAGLAGGEVVAVNGRALPAWLDGVLDPGLDRADALGPGPVIYTVRRDDSSETVAVDLRPRPPLTALGENWSAILFTVVLQVIAGYVLVRRPMAPAASALAVAAVGVTGSTIPWLIGPEVSDIVRGWPFILYAGAAAGLYMLLWPAGAIHLPLAIASATGPGRRTLAIVYGTVLGAYAAGLVASRLMAPSSSAWLATWPVVQMAVVIPTIVVGVALSIVGFRRASPAVREQTRWPLIGGATSSGVSLVLLLVPELVTGRPLIPWSAVGLVALPLPLGIAAGIMRYRLFDIEVVVNRALVYGGVTVSIVGIYAASVSILGSLLRDGGGGGFSASLLATGVAAVVALPIRDVLQRTVNRLMYGDRDDPYRALTRLGRRLEATIDPLDTPTVIVRTVAESLRLPWAAIRLGPAGGEGRTFSHGSQPAGSPLAVPLLYGAEVIGDLLVAPRSPAEPLSAADRHLLEALARQAGTAVHAVSLTLDLIESRARLVAAREEERRRIRRDLHDGLGPTLAAIGMRAELAADLAAGDPAAATSVLGELRGEVHGALADVRRLVDGLRPPALDELGLVGALAAQAGHLGGDGLLRVDARGPLPDLPAAVEVAAYRIAVEAMTNASRHSGATACRVALGAVEEAGTRGALEIEVIDDGRGLPAQVHQGIGLGSMRERAAEVGGTVIVEAAGGGGTRVFARLPLDAPSLGEAAAAGPA